MRSRLPRGNGELRRRYRRTSKRQQQQRHVGSDRHRRGRQPACGRDGRHRQFQRRSRGHGYRASALTVTRQLTFNGGAAASISNGNTFTFTSGGGSLTSTAAAGTLTLSGGVLTLTPTLGTSPAVNIAVAGVNYVGTGPSPDSGTTWNNLGQNGASASLLNSSSAATGISYVASGANGNYFTNNPNAILGTFEYNNGGTHLQTFTFGNLNPAVQYNLYAISNSNGPGRATNFTIGGTTQTVTTPGTFASVSITSSSIYTEFAGLTPSANGQITVTALGAGGGESDVNGFQFVPINTPTGAVNLPSINISAAANSALDFGGYGPANVVGGLGLGGNVTIQNVVSGGSVQIGGNVDASANATIALSAGAGSVPTLVLSGDSTGVQNINAANGTVLALPANSISASTVNIGNATGYNGSVVLGGATSVSSGATVNVNAGSLKVAGALSGAAGANVQVNSGSLVGGPAGSIQVPVTINSGATIVPDASAASTALIGNSLTINANGAFQWVYSGTAAKGTLALGSAALNLPGQFAGNPVFRPQFLTTPAIGTYVMTWSCTAGQRAHLGLRRFARRSG